MKAESLVRLRAELTKRAIQLMKSPIRTIIRQDDLCALLDAYETLKTTQEQEWQAHLAEKVGSMSEIADLKEKIATLQKDNERLRGDLAAGGWTAGKSQLRAMHGELMTENTTLKTLYTEALDALLALRASYIADGGDRTDPGLQIASRVLAKAGRR